MSPELSPELQALQSIVTSMDSLDESARMRVLQYVFQKYGGAIQPIGQQKAGVGLPSNAFNETSTANVKGNQDIRSLREEKKPSSGIEMAVLVGYYLSEIGEDGVKRDTFGSADLTRYFKMAAYALPKGSGAVTLRNAKNAGYLDAAKHGLYRLNPVGYNLIAHKLDRSGASSERH